MSDEGTSDQTGTVTKAEDAVMQAGPTVEDEVSVQAKPRRSRPKKTGAGAVRKDAQPAKRKAGRRKGSASAGLRKETPEQRIERIRKEEDSKVYSEDESLEILKEAVSRKRSELARIERSLETVKRQSTRDSKAAMAGFLRKDIDVYVAVIADLTDDKELFESVDAQLGPIPFPEDYDRAYLAKLSERDLRNQEAARTIRSEHLQNVLREFRVSVGREAMSSKRGIAVLKEDERILEAVGKVVSEDDTLRAVMPSIDNEKGKQKKSKKKSKKEKKKK